MGVRSRRGNPPRRPLRRGAPHDRAAKGLRRGRGLRDGRRTSLAVEVHVRQPCFEVGVPRNTEIRARDPQDIKRMEPCETGREWSAQAGIPRDVQTLESLEIADGGRNRTGPVGCRGATSSGDSRADRVPAASFPSAGSPRARATSRWRDSRGWCYRPCKIRQLWPSKNRTPRVGDRRPGWAVDRGAGEVPRAFLYSGVSIQHRGRDDREREAGASATLPRAGCAEGGDRSARGSEPRDDLSLDRDGAVGPGSGRRGGEIPAESSGAVGSSIPTRGSSTPGWRTIRG